eukprot:534570_1
MFTDAFMQFMQQQQQQEQQQQQQQQFMRQYQQFLQQQQHQSMFNSLPNQFTNNLLQSTQRTQPLPFTPMPNIINTMPSSITSSIQSTNTNRFLDRNTNNVSKECIKLALTETQGLYICSKINRLHVQFVDDLGSFNFIEIPYIRRKCKHLFSKWSDFQGYDMTVNVQRMEILKIHDKSMQEIFDGLMKKLNEEILSIVQERKMKDELIQQQQKLQQQLAHLQAINPNAHKENQPPQNKKKAIKRKLQELISDSDDYEAEVNYSEIEEDEQDDEFDVQEEAGHDILQWITKHNKGEKVNQALYKKYCKRNNTTYYVKYYKHYTQKWDKDNTPKPNMFHFVPHAGGTGRKIKWNERYIIRKPKSRTIPSHQAPPKKKRKRNKLQLLKSKIIEEQNEQAINKTITNATSDPSKKDEIAPHKQDEIEETETSTTATNTNESIKDTTETQDDTNPMEKTNENNTNTSNSTE